MILPGSLIPSDKYFLKNLTFVVGNPLVWLRHHSSQTLRGQGEEQTTKKQCPSWPTWIALQQRLNSLRNIRRDE